MAYLDEAMGEAYVSPQIESRQVSRRRSGYRIRCAGTRRSSDDKQRWSVEAAELFFTGKPLRSAYRGFHPAMAASYGFTVKPR